MENQTDLAACKRIAITNISVKSSLLLLQLSNSVVHCSIEGNFHFVIEAVFLSFLASLSFAFFVFLLAPYPSNTTQMSLAHPRLPHPGGSYPPIWHAYSINADDVLYVQHFLSQWHSSAKYCLGAAAHSDLLSYAAITQFDLYVDDKLLKTIHAELFYLPTIITFFFSFCHLKI